MMFPVDSTLFGDPKCQRQPIDLKELKLTHVPYHIQGVYQRSPLIGQFQWSGPYDKLTGMAQKLAGCIDQLKENLTKVQRQTDDVSAHLSQHDRSLIEDRVRDTEAVLSKLELDVQHKLAGYKLLEADLNVITEKTDQYILWLGQLHNEMSSLDEQTTDVDVNKINRLKNLEDELNKRQVILHDLNEKTQKLLIDLPLQDKESLEKLMFTSQTKHNEVCQSLSQKLQELQEKADVKLELAKKLDKELKLLQDRESELETMNVFPQPHSIEAEKMFEKCKSLSAKVNFQSNTIRELKAKADSLVETLAEKERLQIISPFEELSKRHKELMERINEKQKAIQEYCVSCKKFDGNILKLEAWCREIIQVMSPPDPVSGEAQDILLTLKQYISMIPLYKAVLQEMSECQQIYLPLISPLDQQKLTEQLELISSDFESVCMKLLTEEKQLEICLAERSEIIEKVLSCEEFIDSAQSQLKQTGSSMGPTRQEVESLLNKFEILKANLQGFQPSLNELLEMKEKIAELGLHSHWDTHVRTSEKFEILLNKITHQMEACQAAILLRDTFEHHMTQLELTLRECQSLVCSPEFHQLSRPDSAKLALDKLENVKLELMKAKNRAEAIEQEDAEKQTTALTDRVEHLKLKCENLDKDIVSYQQQMTFSEVSLEVFESAVNSLVAWFEEKEEVMALCGSLPLDQAQVLAIIGKHKMLTLESTAYLKEVKNLANSYINICQEYGLPLSPQFTAKRDEILQLEDLTLASISKKEVYLEEAQNKRTEFEFYNKEVSLWLSQASDLLDSGYDGLDYSTLDETLNELKDFFSDTSLCESSLTHINDVVEQLLPTLDINDSLTLQHVVRNIKHKCSSVLSSSQCKMAALTDKSAQLKHYQEAYSQICSKLDALESDWSDLNKCSDASPLSVQMHANKAKKFLQLIEVNRPLLSDVNEVVRDLDRTAGRRSRDDLSHKMKPLLHRWTNLVGQVEARIKNLEDIEGQWSELDSKMSSFMVSIEVSESRLMVNTADIQSYAGLCQRLDELKEVLASVENMESTISLLHTTRMSLQRALPTAEAKIASQEQFIALMERYESLLVKVREEMTNVQEEVDSRGKLLSTIEETGSWLGEKLSLLQAGQDGIQSVTELKVLEQEILYRMEQTNALEASSQSRYARQGREPPTEIQERLLELRFLASACSMTARDREEELLHLKEDRVKFRGHLMKVMTWCQRADETLRDTVVNVLEAQDIHQALLFELEEVKINVDLLRQVGGDIIRHSFDPEEKRDVQKSLADVNRNWLTLQVKIVEHGQKLTDAADLSHAIDDLDQGIREWLEEAEAVVNVDVSWSSYDQLKYLLRAHRRVHKELDSNQDKVVALNAMVKQLQLVCESPTKMALVVDLKDRVSIIQSRTEGQLSTLEDANKKIEDYEKEISDLMTWMEQARSRLTMRDTTTDLHHQLAVQEVSSLFSFLFYLDTTTTI